MGEVWVTKRGCPFLTKMDELEGHVRSIEMEGLAWGASKLVEVAFGVKKLQIMLTVHDDLVRGGGWGCCATVPTPWSLGVCFGS